MPAKIDVKKRHRYLYSYNREPHFVNVPPLRYLMIHGQGSTEADSYNSATNALLSVMHAIKSSMKAAGWGDFVVPPLEVLRWADDKSAIPAKRHEERKWTAMVMQPDHVTSGDFRDAIEALDKKGHLTPSHARIESGTLVEGKCVQVLHEGPHDGMGGTIEVMHEAVAAKGLKLVGMQHEIYISGTRRIAPEKLKTVLRNPVN